MGKMGGSRGSLQIGDCTFALWASMGHHSCVMADPPSAWASLSLSLSYSCIH